MIVSFLTPDELRRIFDDIRLEIVYDNKNRQKVPKIWKYIFIMSNIGLLLLIGQKNSNQGN